MTNAERFGVNFANKMPKSKRGRKMSNASLSDGVGPGSSISLAPETIRVRNALIEKFSGSPLEEMTNFMAMALSSEKDELRRLGILAARIYILRNRVSNLKNFNRDASLTSIPKLDTATLSISLPTVDQGSVIDEENNNEIESWSRIQMTEPGEVNGVRFLTGTIIDTQPKDAEKLIQSGKAIRVDEDGNVIDSESENEAAETASEVETNLSETSPADDLASTSEVLENSEPETSEEVNSENEAETPENETKA